jgi:anti-sigma factor RsiW
MTPPGPHLDWPSLVGYWAGDLSQAEEAAHEEHLFACEECSLASERIAAITETLRGLIPPILSPEVLAKLTAQGLKIVDNPMLPGERREVEFPKDAEILLHRLRGLALDDAQRVSFVLRSESSQQVIVAIDDVLVDRANGQVLVACQKHFSSYPPDTVAEVRVHAADGGERLSTYTILHRWL